MEKRNNYQWQGENVKVTFGYCQVKENLEKPLYWYNYECNWDFYYNKPKRGMYKSALIPAVKVKYEDQEFVISNHFGIGYRKLIKGGWPNHNHFSLPIDGFVSNLSKDEYINYCIRKFDLESYEQHESNRNKWKLKNYPKELEEIRIKFGRF